MVFCTVHAETAEKSVESQRMDPLTSTGRFLFLAYGRLCEHSKFMRKSSNVAALGSCFLLWNAHVKDLDGQSRASRVAILLF